MNILGDFISRVNNLYPAEVDNEQLESLFTTIKNQDQELAMKDKEIDKLQQMLAKLGPKAEKKAPAKKAAAKADEPAEKKAPAKRTKKAAAKAEEPAPAEKAE